MFPAVNAWSLPDGLDAAAQLAAAAQAGFAGVELVVGPDSALRPDAAETDCGVLADRAEDLGLRIVGLATGEFWKFNYASQAEADRHAALDLTRRLLDLAVALRTDAVLVVPAVVGKAFDPRPQVAYADALNQTFEALSVLRHDAEARGVVIAIENVWNRFLLSPVECADLIDRVNSPYVGVYFDTGNVLAFGYPQDWIATLGGRIARVHAKDYDLSKAGAEGFCPLGAGSVDWPAVIAALMAAGYDGPLTYEGGGEPAEASARLKSILAGRPTDTQGATT